jgi:hypothetical protein
MVVPEPLRRLPASWSDPGVPASEYCGHGTFCAKFGIQLEEVSKMMAVDREPTLDTGRFQGDDLGIRIAPSGPGRMNIPGACS